MNKKQVIIYIIILVIVSSIVGIVSYNIGIRSNNVSNVDSNVKDNSKVKSISKKEFAKYIKKVELTQDNWKNYFEIKREKEEEKNAFGEVTQTHNWFTLKLKDEYYNNSDLIETAIKLSNPYQEYNKEHVFEFKSNYSGVAGDWADSVETLSIDDLECTKIKGTLYYLQGFPIELWQENDIKGNKYKCIVVENDMYYPNLPIGVSLKDFIE